MATFDAPTGRTADVPAGLSIRPATHADLASVYRLRAVCDTADFGEPLFTEEQLAANWRATDFDPDKDTWVACDAGGRVVGYAEVRGGLEQAALRVAVPPEWRGRGLGRWLLGRAEARAAALGTAQIVSPIGGRNAAARCLLARSGYANELTFLIMAITLTEPPATANWPAGLVVRPFVVGRDERATYAADEEASVDKGYYRPLSFEEWSERMGLAGVDPALWFLAWDGDEVAGVALNHVATATGIGWADHLGVRRPWRGRGLGAALLQQSFGAFYDRGIREVRLSVDEQSRTNATRVYERAGMTTIRRYHVFTKMLG